jgi:arabinofuranosyltransferase
LSTLPTPEPTTPGWVARLTYGAITGCAALLFALGVRSYLLEDYFADDAFISLRYAQRLAQGKGLSWNDGEFVEGYSNLLWVLAEAANEVLGIDPILGMRALSIGGMGIGLLCLALFLRPGRTGSLLPGAFAMTAYATTQLNLIATASGFETPFVIGFLSLALLILLPAVAEGERTGLRPFLLAGLPLGAVALTRPDGALFTALVTVSLALLSGGLRRGLLRGLAAALGPALCVAGQLSFRLWRYHDWIPNTARVKVPGGLERCLEGLRYVIDGLHYQRGIWLVSLLGLAMLLWPRKRVEPGPRRQALMLCLLGLGWTAYVIWAGGVWLTGRRFLVATMLILVWLAGLGLSWLVPILKAQRRRTLGLGMLVLALGSGLGWLQAEQWRDPQINRAIHNQFKWHKKGILLNELWTIAFAQRGTPTIAVDIAGAIPYYTGWPTIDMLGLNDRWIATHPPEEVTWTLSGHTHGDGAYVIDRAPDLVLFGVHWGTRGGVFVGGEQMLEDPLFHERYRYIEMERLEPRSPRIRIWLRLESPVLGVIRTDDRLEVPAWFVTNATRGQHRVDDALRLPLGPGEPATAHGITVPAGCWLPRARFEPGTHLPTAFSVVDADSGEPIPWDEQGALVLERERSLDIRLMHGGDEPLLLLEALVLERAPAGPALRPDSVEADYWFLP